MAFSHFHGCAVNNIGLINLQETNEVDITEHPEILQYAFGMNKLNAQTLLKWQYQTQDKDLKPDFMPERMDGYCDIMEFKMLQSKDRTEDGQYYVFAHDTRYVTDALSQGFYDEYHTDYAVNRKTGEVLRESQWIETDAGYKLLYSEAYEKAVNQLYFNEDVSDGKMLEEQAARALFYYMYSDEGDYDSIVVRTYKQEQSVYVYQFPEDQEFPCVRNFSCRGMTEDQEYYIFADYTDYYTHGYEPVFTHYQYLTSYAVNRETGEVLREREWSDIECEWLYNEEYKKAVK